MWGTPCSVRMISTSRQSSGAGAGAAKASAPESQRTQRRANRTGRGVFIALHPCQRAEAEEVQAGFEENERARAEEEAAGADGGIVDEDFIGVVERAVVAGELE